MLNSIGKIVAINLLNKSIFIEIDKSQIQSFDGKDYCNVMYKRGNNIECFIIELTKHGDKQVFEIEYSSKKYKDAWNELKQNLGRNIWFTPKRSYTNSQKKFHIDDIYELIII